MELRVLQYFLAVAREQNISAAAESLHLTQPTLSRQIKDLEEELGKQLLIRGKRNRRVVLTKEGVLLRKRAEEIVDLVMKTEKEVSLSDAIVSGDVYVGSAETDAVRVIARVARQLRESHPGIHFHIVSGDAGDILERIDKGLLDFGFLIGNHEQDKYEFLPLPMRDHWGVLMPKNSELAEKEAITARDLKDKPLILSRQAAANHELTRWLKRPLSELNVVATYNLIYNGSLMVEEGMGYALGLDRLINTTGESGLCFRPLSPPLDASMAILWKKYQIFSPAAELFIERLRRCFAE